MDYSTALRQPTIKRLEELKKTDILVGIPCYNNEGTITNVINMVSEGLNIFYPDYRAVVFISDGGSTDDTRDVAASIQLRPWQERIVQIYRGIGGKGTAFRAIFEAVTMLGAEACMVVDSDLRSISPGWVKSLLEPVLDKKAEFVAPVYTRYKYDGTITNNIVYNLTRAVFGKSVRQPIGGDFAFSRELAKFYLDQPVWTTDIAKYGIDIWMTINAIAQNRKVGQANLGVKIHDAKDPAQSLGPMFVQVVGTLFDLMEEYESLWKNIKGSSAVPLFGTVEQQEPDPIKINLENLVREYSTGFKRFKPLYKSIFSAEVYRELEQASKMPVDGFTIPIEIWVKTLYETASIYRQWQLNRQRLINLMVPLYFGRVASFVNRTLNMSSVEAEAFVEQQAVVFEDLKDYLVKVWSQERKEPDDF